MNTASRSAHGVVSREHCPAVYFGPAADGGTTRSPHCWSRFVSGSVRPRPPPLTRTIPAGQSVPDRRTP